MVCGLLSVVCGLWSVVCGLWSVVCGLWSVVCGLWSVVFFLFSAVSCLLSIVYCLCSVSRLLPPFLLIPERLARLEGVLNSLQCLSFSTQGEKGLPLEVKQVLLGNSGGMVGVTTREDVGELFPYQRVVI